MMTESDRNDLARTIAESDITDGQLDNSDIDALVDLFRGMVRTEITMTTLREYLITILFTLAALAIAAHYFNWLHTGETK